MIHQQMIAAFGLESLSNEQLSSYLVIAGWVFTIVQVSMPQNFFFIRYKFCGRRSPSVCPPCESVQQSQMSRRGAYPIQVRHSGRPLS
jgi:hypothetical protein